MTRPNRTRPSERGERWELGEEGSMAVEMAILTIPLVVILLFLVALARYSDARNQVDEAARDAARAGSTYLTPTQASQFGTQVARTDLTGICTNATIQLDTTDLHPGGQVTATVTCRVPVADLGLLQLPANRTVTATSTSVVDTYIQGQ